jgi:integrase
VVNSLKRWKLACPKSEPGLVFPALQPIEGKVEHKVEQHANLANTLERVVLKAGLTVPKLDEQGKPVTDKKGKPIVNAKYTGLHALRHFYASWLINRPEEGGLGLPAKIVQERMGHATIGMTMDTYGHLFPSSDDGKELAAAETVLLGLHATQKS